ncbi:MAG TPA: CPBP family intramembrane glutamic endopeptidase [Allosphingosinicella sp.]|nr:CPBP family intramembrane glutamic endopeptidase [Allosphingosinicella sp.]
MDYLTIALTPALLAAAGLVIVRFRRLSWRDDVGFKAPRLVDLVFWCAIFVLIASLGELVSEGGAAGSWRGRYSAADLAVRIVAVALVYPIAEEFFFRGVFLGVVRRRLGNVAGVVLPAIMFGLIHVQYDWRGMAFVALDGLIFGVCRVRTGSVYVPMLLHILGNSYAVWERLA